MIEWRENKNMCAFVSTCASLLHGCTLSVSRKDDVQHGIWDIYRPWLAQHHFCENAWLWPLLQQLFVAIAILAGVYSHLLICISIIHLTSDSTMEAQLSIINVVSLPGMKFKFKIPDSDVLMVDSKPFCAHCCIQSWFEPAHLWGQPRCPTYA